MSMTIRMIRLGLALAVSAGVFATAAVPAGAQERVERRSILQLLFGTPKRREIEPEPEFRKPRPVVRKKKAAAAVAKTPEPAAIEKLPDAKVVLVVGDFIAGSLGEGLVAAFETTPGIVVERQSNGSSGIVRDDYYSWPDSLPTLIAEKKPALIVISMGANDRQQMTVAGQKEKFRSEAWTKEYEARVARIATQARQGDRPLLWMGMPAFQSSALTADMTTLNTIYRAAVERTGGTFVDIWDGFVDESGKFVITGSDVNGQQVRLRGSDGVSMTKAGKRKMAFYVEKEIRRILGDAMTIDGQKPGGEAVSKLGAKWARVELVDSTEGPQLSNEAVSRVQSTLADYHASGVKVLLVVDYTTRAGFYARERERERSKPTARRACSSNRPHPLPALRRCLGIPPSR